MPIPVGLAILLPIALVAWPTYMREAAPSIKEGLYGTAVKMGMLAVGILAFAVLLIAFVSFVFGGFGGVPLMQVMVPVLLVTNALSAFYEWSYARKNKRGEAHSDELNEEEKAYAETAKNAGVQVFETLQEKILAIHEQITEKEYTEFSDEVVSAHAQGKISEEERFSLERMLKSRRNPSRV